MCRMGKNEARHASHILLQVQSVSWNLSCVSAYHHSPVTLSRERHCFSSGLFLQRANQAQPHRRGNGFSHAVSYGNRQSFLSPTSEDNGSTCCCPLQALWPVKFLRTWTPSSSAVEWEVWASPCCWPKWERKFWSWSSTTGLEDAATRSRRRALSLTSVRLWESPLMYVAVTLRATDC